MTKLVVDASVAIVAVADERGFALLGEYDLVAPRLMWSEATSVLHTMVWRRAASREDGEIMLDRLERCPVAKQSPSGLIRRSWSVADRLGWAKTYDAEYVALAQMLDCDLVTIDLRLHRAATGSGRVRTLDEL